MVLDDRRIPRFDRRRFDLTLAEMGPTQQAQVFGFDEFLVDEPVVNQSRVIQALPRGTAGDESDRERVRGFEP